MVKPLGGRVLVKPLKQEELSPGGIVLPDSAAKRPQEGEVVAVGPGRILEDGSRAEMPVAVGQRVIFPEYGGTEIKIDSVEYLIIEDEQILAVREVEARKPQVKKPQAKKPQGKRR